MRLGIRSSNDFIISLNSINDQIQETYLSLMKDLTKSVSVKVMLGDSTITEQLSFDPELVRKFYEKITNNLKDWTIQEISVTNNEDLRRIFTKFEIRLGNYLLSGHMSLQFHVLLYYKPEYRVIECQKELSEIIDKTKGDEQTVAELGDQLILEKLKAMGYNDLNEQKLFEIFFEIACQPQVMRGLQTGDGFHKKIFCGLLEDRMQVVKRPKRAGLDSRQCGNHLGCFFQ